MAVFGRCSTGEGRWGSVPRSGWSYWFSVAWSDDTSAGGEQRQRIRKRETTMGAMKRLAKFTGGGVVGAAIGSVTATLLAPQSGSELQRKLRDRLMQAKLAGVTAKAEKQEAL